MSVLISLFNHTATFRRESDYPLSTHFIQDLEELTNTPPVPTAEKNRWITDYRHVLVSTVHFLYTRQEEEALSGINEKLMRPMNNISSNVVSTEQWCHGILQQMGNIAQCCSHKAL